MGRLNTIGCLQSQRTNQRSPLVLSVKAISGPNVSNQLIKISAEPSVLNRQMHHSRSGNGSAISGCAISGPNVNNQLIKISAEPYDLNHQMHHSRSGNGSAISG